MTFRILFVGTTLMTGAVFGLICRRQPFDINPHGPLAIGDIR